MESQGREGRESEEGESQSKTKEKRKFYVVEFDDGHQVVPGIWLDDEFESCSWPPWGSKLSSLAYDKKIKELPEPDQDWIECKVLRVRASGDNFQYVRKKLAEAVNKPDVNNLNTDAEDVGRGKRLRVPRKVSSDSEDMGELENDIRQVSKAKFPDLSMTPGSLLANVTESVSKIKEHVKPTVLAPKSSTPKITPSKVLSKEAAPKLSQLSAPKSKPRAPLLNEPSTSSLTKTCSSSVVTPRSDKRPDDPTPRPESSLNYEDDTFFNDIEDFSMDMSPASVRVDDGRKTDQAKKKPTVADKALLAAQRLSEIEFRAFLIRILFNNKETLAHLKTEVNRLTNIYGPKKNAQASSQSLSGVLEGLPCLQREAFEDWDKKLKEANFAKEVVNELSHVRGDDFSSTTRAILSTVMANCCAEQYSWQGSFGKKASFSILNFKQVLFNSVRQSNLKFEKTPDGDIEKVVKKWLALAKQRSGGREIQSCRTVSGQKSTPRKTPQRLSKLQSPYGRPGGSGRGIEPSLRDRSPSQSPGLRPLSKSSSQFSPNKSSSQFSPAKSSGQPSSARKRLFQDDSPLPERRRRRVFQICDDDDEAKESD